MKLRAITAGFLQAVLCPNEARPLYSPDGKRPLYACARTRSRTHRIKRRHKVRKKMRKNIVPGLLVCLSALAGCSTAPPVVHQQDLDTWVGVPVAALDSHPLFSTLPVVRTVGDNGVEIRDYVNKKYAAGCLPANNPGAKKRAKVLSARQREVVQLLAEGKSMKQIASKLHAWRKFGGKLSFPAPFTTF